MPVDEEFKVDRPFLFMLRHNPTGIWLSIGRLVKPEERSESTFTSALNNVANNLGSIIVPIEAADDKNAKSSSSSGSSESNLFLSVLSVVIILILSQTGLFVSLYWQKIVVNPIEHK